MTFKNFYIRIFLICSLILAAEEYIVEDIFSFPFFKKIYMKKLLMISV